MSTSGSGLVGADGATPLRADASPPPSLAETERLGLAAVRASHIVALATAQSAMATAAMVARNNGKPVEAVQAENVSLQLAQLALALRGALARFVEERKLRDRHDYTVIPPYLVESVDEYARTGRETGGFLRAVLENDLASAVAKADNASLPYIPHLVGYLTNAEHIPSRCWGSPMKVAQSLPDKAAQRVEDMKAHDELLAEGSRPLPDDDARVFGMESEASANADRVGFSRSDNGAT